MNMREILARNLRMLLARNGWSEHELGRRSGVSPRTINTITNQQSNATTGVIAKLARPFNLEPWHLLLPNLPDDSSLRSRIEDLIGYYCRADVETQGFVDHILRHGKLTP